MAFPERLVASAALALLTFAPPVHAADACVAPVDTWLAVHPFAAGETGASKLVAWDCAPWPGDDNVTIVAAIYQGGQDDRKNIALALVDNAKDRVRSAFKGVVVEDPFLRIGPDSLRIDTARYQLARGVRAFGLDLSSAASLPPCADAGWQARRTLFVAEGSAIRPVLDALSLSSWKRMPDPARCASDEPVEGSTTTTTIAIGAHATHGFADLVVTDLVEPDAGPARRRHNILRYDGSTYLGDGVSTHLGPVIEPEATARR
jgi:hypothetical protein